MRQIIFALLALVFFAAAVQASADHDQIMAEVIDSVIEELSESEVAPAQAAAQAALIIKYEGRFDKNGRLMLYKLPSGDGGGTYVSISILKSL